MKKIVSTVVTVSMVMALFAGTAFAAPGNGNGNGNAYGKSKGFKDMKGHWGTESVEKIQSYGLINGYDDGSFQPDKAITQGELAVIIDRLLQLQKVTTTNSAIVTDGALTTVPDWAKDAVSNGFKKNYLNLKRFHSQTQCDRLMATVALAKALNLQPVTDFANNPFKDRGLMSDEDYGYVLALYNAGYIKGYPNGNFNPNALISRAQLASMIDKIVNGGTVVTDDKEKPVWATGSAITASAIDSASVVLNWTAATDNVKVTGYKVSYYIDNVEKEKLVATNTAKITGLTAEKKYTFTVEARDAAGNWSINGPTVEVTTLAAPVADTTSPVWPTSAALTVSPSSSAMVTVIWPDATDNTAVTGYKVYQDGVLVKTLGADANDLIISGLKEKTEYVFKVRAFDAAGNVSSILENVYLTN